MTIHEILEKYWGYKSFRPLQEDIINSVLDKHDTLALLPTGGGKSLCFQVPVMKMEGVCIVVTPLIALMKDQVANLNKRNIKASAIFSGQSRTETDIALTNAIYGQTKFIYVSPERLQTRSFRESMQRMKICLLAIDEAHCISQWGYDFRPPYLKIAEIREFFPKINILALTATATPEVVKDIQSKLEFKDQKVFSKSFSRPNLTYVVQREQNKLPRLIRIVNNLKGSGIVYVRNRKKTREIAEFLHKNRISATYYHAGLDSETRSTRQNEWMQGKKQVIVATNAFGMGIDKPDVRFVVHMDLPDSIEAYFQEAGRAGRDEQAAYGILLANKSDVIDAQRMFELQYPPIKEIKRIYTALGNYFQIAEGSGLDKSFEFDLSHFSNNYNLQAIVVYNALKFLEKEGYIYMNDMVNQPSKALIMVNKNDLYQFQVEHPKYDRIIKVMLRSWTGLMTDYTKIYESDVAKMLKMPIEEVKKALIRMSKLDIIDYIPRNKKPMLVFTQARMDEKNIRITEEVYGQRKKEANKRINAVIEYLEDDHRCRSRKLLSYLGESDSVNCEKCDVCLSKLKLFKQNNKIYPLIDQIKNQLLSGDKTYEELQESLQVANTNNLIEALRYMMDNEEIEEKENSTFSIRI
jgi:ATP-dependent DNA helicase RecQ